MTNEEYYKMLAETITSKTNSNKYKTNVDPILDWDGKGQFPSTIKDQELTDAMLNGSNVYKTQKDTTPLEILENVDDYNDKSEDIIVGRLLEEMDQFEDEFSTEYENDEYMEDELESELDEEDYTEDYSDSYSDEF